MFWKKLSKKPKESTSCWIEINYKIWQEKIYKTKSKQKLPTNSRKNDFTLHDYLPYIIISFIINRNCYINIYIQIKKHLWMSNQPADLSINYLKLGFLHIDNFLPCRSIVILKPTLYVLLPKDVESTDCKIIVALVEFAESMFQRIKSHQCYQVDFHNYHCIVLPKIPNHHQK